MAGLEGPQCRDCAAGYALARNKTCVDAKAAVALCRAAGCASCPENKGCMRRKDRMSVRVAMG
jgi:hypothetical protein